MDHKSIRGTVESKDTMFCLYLHNDHNNHLWVTDTKRRTVPKTLVPSRRYLLQPRLHHFLHPRLIHFTCAASKSTKLANLPPHPSPHLRNPAVTTKNGVPSSGPSMP